MKQALQKIRKCCSKWATTSTSPSELLAFSGADLLPTEFRTIARRFLNLSFTSKELGALCRYFLADDGIRISSKAFLDHFKKILRLEWEQNRQRKVVAQRKLVATLRTHELAIADNRLASSYTGELKHDENDVGSFLEKMKAAAQKYANNRSGCGGDLQIFKAGNLTPSSFKDAFHRAFLITLSWRECGVLLDIYDGNGSGNISGLKFLHTFLKLSRYISSRQDQSDDEMMGILRSEDIRKPLVSAYNDGPHRRRSTSPESRNGIIKTFRAISPTQPMSQVMLPLLIAETKHRSTPKKSRRSMEVGNVFLKAVHTTQILLRPKECRDAEHSRQFPKDKDERDKDSENKPREFVFPALLSSAPLFIPSSGLAL